MKKKKKCPNSPTFSLFHQHIQAKEPESPMSSALGSAGRPGICFLARGCQCSGLLSLENPGVQARACFRIHQGIPHAPICYVTLPFSPVQVLSALAVKRGPCSVPAWEHFGITSKAAEISIYLFLFPGRCGQSHENAGFFFP